MRPYFKRAFIIDVIALLQIALFVYAAVSKLNDLENFQVQLGQSPMLSAFAGYLAIGVPVSELIIAVLIAFPRTRLVGFFAAFSLMVMFSAYIFIILNYGAFVPCSCGGVLEKMGWKEHLFFNLFFVLILAGAIFLESRQDGNRFQIKPLRIGACLCSLLVLSAIAVGSLYLLSEDIIRHRNNFVRRFPKFSEPESRKLDLGSNAFYFAGAEGTTIYLGNAKAPRVITAIDTTFKTVKKIVVEIDNMDLPFVSVQVRVEPPFFYLTDGTVPCVFKGLVKDWKAKLLARPALPFTSHELIGQDRMAIKTIDTNSIKSTLGILDLRKGMIATWRRDLLISKGDGIFDVDGQLLRNGLTDDFHYIHFYRNEFFTTDNRLQLVSRGHTIDTVFSSNLKVAHLRERGERKLSAPALTVNRTAAAYGNLLLINSQLIGKYEDAEVWGDASVIDIYNTKDNSYCSSLYVYHVNKKPMSSFIVRGNTLYALSGNWLSAVPIDKGLINKCLNQR